MWDAASACFKYTSSSRDLNLSEEDVDQYVFIVCREFDPQQTYVKTEVVIYSWDIRECLQHVLAGHEGTHFEEHIPRLDSKLKLLIPYLDEIREDGLDVQYRAEDSCPQNSD